MKISKLVIHHSASNSVTTKATDIEMWHKQRGFSQVGYHKIIERSGSIIIGRPESLMGAHAKGANENSLAVCVIGDFETEIPTESQKNSLVSVLTEWCKKYKLNSSNIYGHFNVIGGSTKTVCPGKNLSSVIPIIKKSVENNLKIKETA